MDSFHQHTYTAEPQWEYPDVESSFVPVAQGMTNFHPPGHAAYPIEQLDGTAFTQYMPQQPDSQANEVPLFQIPRVPASAYPLVTTRRSARREHIGAEGDDRREKIRRTRTACEECRKRKQKCDGSEPCLPCSEQSTECRYRDVPPTKKDDTMDKMLQLAENYNKTLACLTKDLDDMSGTLRSIEQRLERNWQAGSESRDGGAMYLPLSYRQPAQDPEEYGRDQVPLARSTTSARQRRNPRSSSRQ